MKIQNISDLHLEFGPIEVKNAGADVLTLSGDIIVAKDINRPNICDILEESEKSRMIKHFFKMLSLEFENIIYVFGNHEHYHGNIETSADLVREMLDYNGITNIHVLENNSVKIDDVIFIGGTLWTDCNHEDPMTMVALRSMMNDYVLVNNGDKKLTPEHTVEFHKETIKYINLIAGKNPDKKIVVVGHHAPSKQSTHPRYTKENLMNGGYSTDLVNLILNNPNIKLWTHGHTHESFDYMIGGTRILCNPRGYYNYAENSLFYVNKVVEI